MLSEFTANVVDFAARLLAGGVFELVVFVILVILAIVVVILAIWLAWKLLVLLAKGFVWLVKTTFAFGRESGAARRERRLGALPRVATGWASRSRVPLRSALAQARRTAGENALRIVVVANEGSFGDLCAGLGAAAPAPATFAIAARDGLVLVDASQASLADLRTLGRSLPWSRALDAAAVVVRDESVPVDSLVRTGAFARACGLELALHVVVSSPSRAPVWALFGRARPDGRSLCDALARDASRWWLGGGSREGLDQLVGARSRELASELDRAIGAVPSPSVRFASLALGGAGLAAAVSQSTSLTRPARTTAVSSRVLYGACVGFVALSVYTAMALLHQSLDLHSAVETAEREASTTWVLTDVDTVPNPARVYRVVRSAMRLSEMSGFLPLAPLAALLPDARAPRDLGAALFEAYLLRPLAAALADKIEADLVPVEDARAWLVGARRAGEWLAAWDGLADEPEQVDLSTLLADAFGDQASAWPDRPERALTLSLATVPAPEDGGLDVAYLSTLVRDRFVETMSLWAHGVYTNGPVAAAARVVADERADWHRRYRALIALRQSLSDPAQRWITAAKDTSDYRYESWIYGRSVGMAVLGTGATVEAKAAVSAIRITAREAATTFTAPGIGPILVRSSAGASGGAQSALALSSAASAWLSLLEGFQRLGVADLPPPPDILPHGALTLHVPDVLRTRGRLRGFDRLASQVPQGLPFDAFAATVAEGEAELQAGTLNAVERAVRPFDPSAYQDRLTVALSELESGIEALDEIAAWFAERAASAESDSLRAIRSRVALTVLGAGADVLEARDPLAIHFDAGADRQAMVRRFERGVSALEQIYKQYAKSNATVAASAGERLALEWTQIGRDLEGYRSGDPVSAISALSGMVRAYAENPVQACAAQRSTHAGVRDDYAARALARYAADRARVCHALRLAGTRRVYDALVSFYETHLVSLWPYSTSLDAPEAGTAELSTFVERVRAGTDALLQIEGRYSALFAETARFWNVESDPLAVEFRLEWRARRAEELNARHIIGFAVQGPEPDEDGVYTWRYGTPFAVRLRLAKDSPLRFADATDASGLERRVAYPGNGALIRALSRLDPLGMWSFSGILVNAAGARHDLRISARFERRDGAALRAPAYPVVLPAPSTGGDRLRHVDLTTTEELLLRFQPSQGGDELRLLDPPAPSRRASPGPSVDAPLRPPSSGAAS